MTAGRVWRGGMIGAWSDVQLAVWSAVPNARIVALADRHPERRRPITALHRSEQQFDDAAVMVHECQLGFLDICKIPRPARGLRCDVSRAAPVPSPTRDSEPTWCCICGGRGRRRERGRRGGAAARREGRCAVPDDEKRGDREPAALV